MPKRQRRRPMHYLASSLSDGTVLAAYPMRKPAARIMKRDHLKVDAVGVVIEYLRNGKEISDPREDTRMRFQNIIAVNLNTRRAIRGLVLPVLDEIRAELQDLRQRLDRLGQAGS